MSVGPWVFIDGAFQSHQTARLSPFDRGFLFGHAAYEVIAVYGGQMIDCAAHLMRLERTLESISIPMPAQELEGLFLELMARNQLSEGLIYLQVSGGSYGLRDFAGPDVLTPSLFAYCDRKALITEPARTGAAAITLPDTRWARRDLKTTQLLSQALAYRAAREAGATTALMHEEGLITEAASANAWIVSPDHQLITRNLSHSLLPGITRQSLISLLEEMPLQFEERAFSIEEAKSASEIFTSSSGAMILPIIRLDGKLIANGTPGPVTRAVQKAYYRYIGVDIDAQTAWLS